MCKRSATYSLGHLRDTKETFSRWPKTHTPSNCQHPCEDSLYSICWGSGSQTKSFNDWCTQKIQDILQFQFWHTTLQLELVILSYVRSLKKGNFDLYIDSLTHLAPWFFSLGHTNYVRWVPIHIRDMALLKTMHPEVSVEFRQCHFTVKKTTRSFSAIAVDQAHEQTTLQSKVMVELWA